MNRGIYEEHEQDEITEFTLENIVVMQGDHYYTPPIESVLLGGTYRKILIESGEIEKIIKKIELQSSEEN
jgi:para-aminobenzoate synthetase/4-amino-4-deoxychorismate lyase